MQVPTIPRVVAAAAATAAAVGLVLLLGRAPIEESPAATSARAFRTGGRRRADTDRGRRAGRYAGRDAGCHARTRARGDVGDVSQHDAADRDPRRGLRLQRAHARVRRHRHFGKVDRHVQRDARLYGHRREHGHAARRADAAILRRRAVGAPARSRRRARASEPRSAPRGRRSRADDRHGWRECRKCRSDSRPLRASRAPPRSHPCLAPAP